MVIDLEDAAEGPSILPVDYQLRDWDEYTCEAGCTPNSKVYTAASDVRQIGKLLYPFLGWLPGVPPAAVSFVQSLLDKRLTASQALKHQWLALV
jgi:hypothetical protein